jgi:putative membrane transporter
MNPILPRPLHIAARIVLASAGSYWVSALAAGTVPLYAGGSNNAVYGGTLLGIMLLPLVFLWALAARRLRTVFCVLSLSVLLLSAAGGLPHG